MKSPQEIANTFLAAMPASRQDRTRDKLEILVRGMNGDPIYGGEFTEAKKAVDYSFEIAWKELHDAARPEGGKWSPGTSDVRPGWADYEAVDDTMGYVSGVRTAIAASKKLAKLRLQTPFAIATRRLVAATLPFAELMEKLKKNVVKGKRPPAGGTVKDKRKAALATRAGGSGSCQICSGDWALMRGLISLHGYKRPGLGFITGSCMGANELPYEQSCDVLKKYVAMLTKLRTDAHDRLAKLPFATEITVSIDEYKNGRWVPNPTMFRKGDPMFEEHRRQRIRTTERTIEQLTSEIVGQQRRVDAWRPPA